MQRLLIGIAVLALCGCATTSHISPGTYPAAHGYTQDTNDMGTPAEAGDYASRMIRHIMREKLGISVKGIWEADWANLRDDGVWAVKGHGPVTKPGVEDYTAAWAAYLVKDASGEWQAIDWNFKLTDRHGLEQAYERQNNAS